MLRTLYIRDYAIIDELEVEFEGGLNILTGETGAGKSIMIGALKLILGERAPTGIIRSGARKAIIEGVFDAGASPDLAMLLEENEIPSQPVLILRREIAKTHSRGYINDSPATLPVMRRVAAQLIDLHGQHEHQSLLREETHLNLIDSFGGLAGMCSVYSQAYVQVRDLIKEHEALKTRQSSLEASRERLTYEIEEIDSVAPQEGEEDTLRQEMNRLEHAEQLHSVTARLHSMLYAREDSTADQLAIAQNELRDLARIDPALEAASQEIEQAQISVTEIAATLQDYSARIEFSPSRLEEIRDRLGELDTLKRKYGGSVGAVLDHRVQIAKEYEIAVNYDATLEKVELDLADVKKTLSDTANELSLRRREVAKEIESSITAEFARLGMAAGKLRVRIQKHTDPAGWVSLQTAANGAKNYRAYPHGMDDVAFLITTNTGEDFRPLTRVASGGEISRIMLAIKRILAKNDRLPILVFDEIDVGISGSIARKVGRSMAELARNHQVIAITHLPQIAALAHAHYVVEKRVSEGRTITQIRRLGSEESLEQVAMLITGSEVTDAMRQSARELMKN
ncbi:MAG: DNA repair protein RecN [Rhodothermaceae bacterium]|nr:DNA repair protein RecN [Rhodothermaceae bacterium]MXZ58015.1 DNA repair protein RecN [Rhodothermaceae bacterium]MYB91513.1 DNA repair protein RecN [Rhodothermaceae bacterium]MYD69058.1 DNA repair protein RecN [Rhodothermaceae bacterium]MYG43624.1 DNA repair protein RecN [Rhodothermaceae bacterium]